MVNSRQPLLSCLPSALCCSAPPPMYATPPLSSVLNESNHVPPALFYFSPHFSDWPTHLFLPLKKERKEKRTKKTRTHTQLLVKNNNNFSMNDKCQRLTHSPTKFCRPRLCLLPCRVQHTAQHSSVSVVQLLPGLPRSLSTPLCWGISRGRYYHEVGTKGGWAGSEPIDDFGGVPLLVYRARAAVWSLGRSCGIYFALRTFCSTPTYV